MAAFLRSLLILMVSAIFRQRAGARISMADINRVLMTYNAAYDTCREIDDSSGYGSQAAADEACDWAFKALDSIWLNDCSGWQSAACRSVEGYPERQCTCLVYKLDNKSLRKSTVKPFRDCAPYLWTQELAMDQTPAPTVNFRQRREEINNYWQAERSRRRDASYRRQYDKCGSSSGAHTSGGAGTSSIAHTSDYGQSSTACPSFAAGTSVGPVPEEVGEKTERYPKPHACGKCEDKFRSARALFDHQRSHHHDDVLKCPGCNVPFTHRKSYLAHLRKKHPDLHKEETESRKIPSYPAHAEALLPHACSECHRRYSSISGLRDHMKSHTTDDTKCHCCGKTMSSRAILKAHMGNVHPNEPIPEPAASSKGPMIGEFEVGAFVCECGRKFSHKNGLRDHKKSHETTETYCCDCDQTFSSKNIYRNHMKRAHPKKAQAEAAARKEKFERENPEKCQHCTKRFKNARGLRDHAPFHAGQTGCDECDQVFPRKSSLAAHKIKDHIQPQ